MTTETKPMSVDEAVALMRRPIAGAGMMGEKIYVTLYPNGAAQGGTAMVCELDRDAALSLRDRLNVLLG